MFERTLEWQSWVEERAKRIGKGKYGRVLKMSRKPNYEEFTKTSEITAAGILLIGDLGFLIYYLWEHFPGWLKGLL